jgi:hypothetical protein
VPGFHPEFTGRENVFLNGALHGLSRAEIRERMDEIVEFAGIGTTSTCPCARTRRACTCGLGFAVAAHVDADVLLLDEIFAVGDEEFQRKCFGRISQFKQRGGRSCSSRTTPRRSSGSASARSCCRTGMVDVRRPDARGDPRYRSHLARGPRPRGARRGADGVGERRGAHRRRRAPGRDGEERMQFVAGEQLTVRLRVVSDHSVSAASAPVRAARVGRRADRRGLARDVSARLGRRWRAGFRFDVDELPLAEGRFKLRFGLGLGRRCPPVPLARRCAAAST